MGLSAQQNFNWQDWIASGKVCPVIKYSDLDFCVCVKREVAQMYGDIHDSGVYNEILCTLGLAHSKLKIWLGYQDEFK